MRAGKHYPRSGLEFRRWLSTEEQCRDFLFALKYPDGWQCDGCDGETMWWREAHPCEFRCTACGKQYSVTAGTILHRTRAPLVAWFHAGWMIATAKNGASAMEIQRELGLGSYQTAWTILHRFRRAMVFQNRSQLQGTVVEIDETFIGGVAAGKRGRGAKNKIAVLIMVEVYTAKSFGRLRLQVIPNATRATINATIPQFVSKLSPSEHDHEEVTTTVIYTDGFTGYDELGGLGFDHRPVVIHNSGTAAHKHLPGVHRVASLVKRLMLGTHQGRVDPDHLQEYLDEFCFRWNRRSATKVGLIFHRLIEGSIEHDPVTYHMVKL